LLSTARRMLSKKTARIGDEGKSAKRGERWWLCCLSKAGLSFLMWINVPTAIVLLGLGATPLAVAFSSNLGHPIRVAFFFERC
jgi:hypothetical protein